MIDLIFLDKHGDEDHFPDTWTYYRITSVTGLGVPAGTRGATIQACRVKWPTLEDIPPATDSPGLVEYAVAYDRVDKALEQWNIDRERSVLIGIRDSKG